MANKVGYAVHITPGRYLATHETDLSVFEIRNLLDCDCFEVVHLPRFPLPGIVMLVDESGKCKEKSVNPIASVLYAAGCDYIAGDALLVKLVYIPGDGMDIAPLDAKEAEIVSGLVSMTVGAFLADEIKNSAQSAEEGGHKHA